LHINDLDLRVQCTCNRGIKVSQDLQNSLAAKTLEISVLNVVTCKIQH